MKKYICLIGLIIGIFLFSGCVKQESQQIPQMGSDPCPNGGMALEGDSRIYCIPEDKSGFQQYCAQFNNDIAVNLLCENESQPVDLNNEFQLQAGQTIHLGTKMKYSDSDITFSELKIKLSEINPDKLYTRIHCIESGTLLTKFNLNVNKSMSCGIGYNLTLLRITPSLNTATLIITKSQEGMPLGPESEKFFDEVEKRMKK